jgi:mannose-6-phosphate isomerase-like protein (cupin superfamily)
MILSAAMRKSHAGLIRPRVSVLPALISIKEIKMTDTPPPARTLMPNLMMTVNQLSAQIPFVTKDGTTIRSLLDRTNAPVQNQSLAEAAMSEGQVSQRHYHARSEEFYFILEGIGIMEINEESRPVAPGDAIIIPPGAWHQITATQPLRFLCCCAPPYDHEDVYFQENSNFKNP